MTTQQTKAAAWLTRIDCWVILTTSVRLSQHRSYTKYGAIAVITICRVITIIKHRGNNSSATILMLATLLLVSFFTVKQSINLTLSYYMALGFGFSARSAMNICHVISPTGHVISPVFLLRGRILPIYTSNTGVCSHV